MMSAVEVPIITSKWLVLFVRSFTSWHSTCAFVNSIFVRCSAFQALVDDRIESGFPRHHLEHVVGSEV